MRSVEEHQRVVAGLIAARPAGRASAWPTPRDWCWPPTWSRRCRCRCSTTPRWTVTPCARSDSPAPTADDPVTLPVAEDIPAGRTDRLTLAPGTAHRIMTGAPVPAGADAVVPVEATDGGIRTVEIRSAPRRVSTSAAPVRTSPPGRRCCAPVSWSPRRHSAWSPRSARPARRVIPRQRVLVISTGSELVAPGAPLQPGQIYESNAVMLAAAVREAGAEVVGVATCGDDVGQFRAVLERIRRAGRPGAHLRRGQRRRLRSGQGRLRRRRRSEFVKVAMQPGMPQGAGTPGRRPQHRHPAGQPGQRAGVLRGVRPSRAAGRDGPAAPAAATAHGGARRSADLAAAASGSSGAGCTTRHAAPSPATARRPPITCAGWPRPTACSTSARTSPRSPRASRLRCGTCLTRT